MEIVIKRVYETAEPEDGARVLVDRLWPRGVSRDEAKLDAWRKDVAPSSELRKWFDHDPERWTEFKERYFGELDDKRQAIDGLLAVAEGNDRLCLLYAARDTEHNHALVLREYLVEHVLGQEA